MVKCDKCGDDMVIDSVLKGNKGAFTVYYKVCKCEKLKKTNKSAKLTTKIDDAGEINGL